MSRITSQEYSGFEKAYDHFNRSLFGHTLPPCLITLQRKNGTAGYFSAKRFSNRSGSTELTDEIALNPDAFMGADDAEIMQTLVHEMVHLWQEHFGEPSQRTYHNKEWSEKMESVGLMPSSTGRPGGARVGQKMAEYAIEAGKFSRSCRRLFGKGYRPHWQSSYTTSRSIGGPHDDSLTTSQASASHGGGSRNVIEPPERPMSKVKFTCLQCGLNAWAKPSALLLCGACHEADGSLLWMGAVDGSGC